MHCLADRQANDGQETVDSAPNVSPNQHSVSAPRRVMAYTPFLALSLQTMQHVLCEILQTKAAGQQQDA